ncbi:MAG: IS256 family transposase [Pyrinomonadaceae bacterium]|nr:IS256 family transposase [Ardenticatenales bacterium]MBA3570268.1 IS256 family transposase [Pyrinomonadaceae bacterium]
MTEKITPDMLDQLLEGVENAEDLFGQEGLLKQLSKRLLERMLEGELTEHLGYDKHAANGRGSGNSRNGYRRKTLKSEQGELTLQVPRDREGSYEPILVPNGSSRLAGLNEKIIALYARGMSTRDIQAQLQELYGVELSASLISNVTAVVLDEVKAWQSRPLEAVYPIVYLDALVVKVRDNGHVRNKSVYLVLGVTMEGQKELLGMWIAQTEGAKFWLQVVTELKNRGVQDIFIACVDGLKGFPEAIEAVFPRTQVQLCLVHMVRASLKFVSWKERKAVVADLKKIYRAPTREAAETALLEFAERWDKQYPTISRSWSANWERITPFFAYPEEIRRVIYTTNAIEAVNRSLRKVLKTRGALPSDESLFKLLYLALRNITRKWTMPVPHWRAALNQFAIIFEDRLPL